MDDATLLLLLLGVAAVVALLGLAVVLFVRFWRLRRQLETLPGGARWAFWGAVVYTLFPVDVLPDPLVVDDIGVLLASTAYLHRLIRERDSRRRAVTARPPGAGRSRASLPPGPPPSTRDSAPPPAR